MGRPRSYDKRRKIHYTPPSQGAYARYLSNQVDTDGKKLLISDGNTKGLPSQQNNEKN
jgi:hypothetical protein